MPTTQDDQDLNNANSKSRVGATRTRRGKLRKARKEYKASKAEASAAGYSSTKILRKLKSDYKETIAEIDSNASGNRTGANDDIDLAGIDSVSNFTEEAPSDGTDGYWIYYADDTTQFIPNSDLGGTPDDYSIAFSVASGAITGWSANSGATGLWDGVGDSQAEAYVPLRRGGEDVSAGGSYRETIICVSGEPAVTLVKVG